MSEWGRIPFEEVAPSRLGKMLDGKKQTGKHARPYLRNENVQWGRFDLTDVSTMDFDESDREEFLLNQGDLIICEGGEPGRCAIWRGELKECYFQKALHRARPISSMAIPEYLLYLFWWLAGSGGLNDYITSATIAHLTGEKLKQLPIPVPPLAEQRRIAERLEQADRLRRTRRYALELSDTFLPAAFVQLFGKSRSESVAWPKVELVELCDKEDDVRCGPFGTQLNKSEFRTFGIPLWGIKHVNAAFGIKTREFLTGTKADELDEYSLLPGDLVMTRKGTVGNCALYPAHFPRGIMHSDLLRIRLKPGTCSPLFLTHQLHNSRDIERQIEMISGGAIMAGINVGMLKSIEIQLPPLALQQKFAALVERVERLRAVQRESLRQAEHLFASLLAQEFRPLESRL